MGAPIPFHPQTPIVGQPFQIKGIGMPVNAQLTCNCGGADVDVTVLMSAPARCPSCQKTYNLVFNPTTMKLEAQISLPSKDAMPS